MMLQIVSLKYAKTLLVVWHSSWDFTLSVLVLFSHGHDFLLPCSGTVLTSNPFSTHDYLKLTT